MTAAQHFNDLTSQPEPPKRQRHIGRWILMAAGALVVVAMGAAVSAPSSPTTTAAVPTVAQSAPAPVPAPVPVTQAPEPVAPATHHVVYQIGGTATSASVVTYNSDGSTSLEQDTGAAVPWTKEFDFPADQALSIAQVSAQNGGSGTITCTITVDGTVVKTGTATGAYAIASCDASLQ